MSKKIWWMFWIQGFEGGIGPPMCGGPHNSIGAPISNHLTSKLSHFSWMFWIWIFESGIGPPKCGRPHNSARSPISNHQTSKFSHFESRSQHFLWVFWIWGFEGGIGPPTCGGPHNSIGAPISNHQTSKLSHFGSRSQKNFGCFGFEALKMELDPQHVGDLIIPLGPRFQITKHLNIADLVQGDKLFVDVLNSRLGRWNWTSNTWKTLEFNWGHDFKSPNIQI
jgi:hypothetical protein